MLKKAFTLIELLIVLAVLGVLVTLTTITLTDKLKTVDDKEVIVHINLLRPELVRSSLINETETACNDASAFFPNITIKDEDKNANRSELNRLAELEEGEIYCKDEELKFIVFSRLVETIREGGEEKPLAYCTDSNRNLGKTVLDKINLAELSCK